jgi:L-ascorbate metabolism protein UlaG (beta-lactamase superfamily)
MKFTYHRHSCFSVLAAGKTFLFDPFITANPLARAIDVDRIEADFIFVSHGHFDHTTDMARIVAPASRGLHCANVSVWIRWPRVRKREESPQPLVQIFSSTPGIVLSS